MGVKNILLICLGMLLVISGAFSQSEIYIEQIQSVETKLKVIQGVLGAQGNNLIFVSGDKTLRLFDAVSLTEKQILSDLTAPIEVVTPSNTGNTLVAGAANGQIFAIDLLRGASTKRFSIHTQPIKALALQDETFLFSTEGNKSVAITDLSTGSTLGALERLSDNVSLLSIRTGMRQFAVGLVNGQVLTFAFAKFAPLYTLTGGSARITSLSYSADNKYLAAGAIDGNICLWDAETGVLKMKYTQKKPIMTITFDPKGRWMAVSSIDSTIDFYDLAQLSKIGTITEKEGYSVFMAFQSDNSLVTATNDGLIKKWNITTAPPDTSKPNIVFEQPIIGSEQNKSLSNEYEIIGLVYDNREIAEVTLNGSPVKLIAPTADDLLKVPSNMKSVKRFSAKLMLDSIGLNPYEINVLDRAKNLVTQSGTIQRISMEQAVDIQSPKNDSETGDFLIPVKFIPWFDVDTYSISVNMVDLVNEQAVEFKVAGEMIIDEVPLVVGYNKIQLTIKGKNRERFSKSIGVTRKQSVLSSTSAPLLSGGKKSRTAGSGPQKWAVVVGVSDYMSPGITSLKYADKDAEAFANFLRRPEGGGYDSDHIRVLLNKDATLPNVRDALINFLNQAIDMDLVVIYFAGHGMPDPAKPTNMYLLTHDSEPNMLGTTAFPMWDIQTVLARYISAKRVVVFTDACHSGGISVNFATRGLGSTEQNLVNQYIADLSRTKEGIVVFTASAAGEVSQEFPELGHGVFTYYLLKGMEGEADYNNDYTVTINELMQYTEEQVKRKTRGAQNPTRSQTEYDKELTISIIPH